MPGRLPEATIKLILASRETGAALAIKLGCYPSTVYRIRQRYAHLPHPEWQNGRRGERHCRAKLCKRDVLTIRNSELSCMELARHFGISATQVYRVRSGQQWSHVQ
jgi:hypothetical protein